MRGIQLALISVVNPTFPRPVTLGTKPALITAHDQPLIFRKAGRRAVFNLSVSRTDAVTAGQGTQQQ